MERAVVAGHAHAGVAAGAGDALEHMGAVLNAANEVAVDRFVKREISFPRIFEIVKEVMDRHTLVAQPTLEDVLRADAWARQEARCSK